MIFNTIEVTFNDSETMDITGDQINTDDGVIHIVSTEENCQYLIPTANVRLVKIKGTN